ncbi:MAG: hypothetical protein ACRDHF_04675 [Tepidiformaceae bacterium]
MALSSPSSADEGVASLFFVILFWAVAHEVMYQLPGLREHRYDSRNISQTADGPPRQPVQSPPPEQRFPRR